MATIQHWLNWKPTSTTYEKNSGISKTVPDMAYTLKELLEKHTTGIFPEGIEKIPLDNTLIMDELNVPDFDLTQIDELKERNDRLKNLLDKQIKQANEQKEALKIQELQDLKDQLKSVNEQE